MKFELRCGQVAAALGMALLVASSSAFAATPDDEALLKQAQSLFKPLPKDMGTAEFPVTPERTTLGRLLFFDPRISLDGTVSCSKCHQPFLYGTDALAKPIGVMDRHNPRNAPTVLNAALQSAAHWRGDRENVEDQAMKALVGPPSFGQPNFEAAMAKVRSIPRYAEMFRAAFPADKDPVTPANWGKAIGAYERTLVTPSPFDAYLAGDIRALSATPGSVATLGDAVRIMAKVQLGKDLSPQDVDAIVAFLESLTGPLPKDFESVPRLPAAAFR
jgi:cytochrome c peroxidase